MAKHNKKKNAEQTVEKAIPASEQKADWKVMAEYAGLSARVGAALIDLVVLMVPLSLFAGVMFETLWGGPNYGQQEVLMAQQTFNNDPEMAWQLIGQMFSGDHLQRWMTENVIFTFCAGVLLVALWYAYSATPGKMLMGMKIVDADTGMPPNNGQNIIRFLGYHASVLAAGLGIFWIMWDKRRRAWHDMMANTVVVYKKSLPKELADATLKKEEPEG